MPEQETKKHRISRRALMKVTGAGLVVGVAACSPVHQEVAETFGCKALPALGPAKAPPKSREFLSTEGFRNVHIDGKRGFQVKLRVTGYRSIPLWSVQSMELKVDGQTYDPKKLIFTLDQRRYTVDELKRMVGVHWWILDYGTLSAIKEDGLAPGEHEVEATMSYVSTYGRRSLASGISGFSVLSEKRRMTLESEA